MGNAPKPSPETWVTSTSSVVVPHSPNIAWLQENLVRHNRTSEFPRVLSFAGSLSSCCSPSDAGSGHGSAEGPKPFRCCHCHTRFARRDVCKRHSERCRRGMSSHRQDQQEHQYGAELSFLSNAEAAMPSPPSPSASTGSRDAGHRMEVVANQPSETMLASPQVHVAAYFEHFHPSFPLLHQPTFDNTSPKLLRSIVYAIGSLYTAQKLPDGDRQSYLLWSQNLWASEREELISLVSLPPCTGLVVTVQQP